MLDLPEELGFLRTRGAICGLLSEPITVIYGAEMVMGRRIDVDDQQLLIILGNTRISPEYKLIIIEQIRHIEDQLRSSSWYKGRYH